MREMLFVSIFIFLVGCRAQQLEGDQRDIRGTLLHLYEEQVMDNLVRAKLGYPVIQVDYSNLTGTLTQTGTLSIGDADTVTQNGFGRLPRKGGFSIPAQQFPMNHVRTNVLSPMVSGTNVDALTITGQPVNTVNSVYEAYVTVAQDKDFLRGPFPMASVTRMDAHQARIPLDPAHPERRTKVSVHLDHVFEEQYYYIPEDALNSKKFMDLYFKTTVERQQLVPVPIDFTTTILSVDNVAVITPHQFQLRLLLKDKIPNDSGELSVSIAGKMARFAYHPSPDVPPGQGTNSVIIDASDEQAPNLKADELAKALEGKSVTLHNQNFAPGFVAPPSNPLEPVRSQLELQRLQMFGR